MKCISCGKRFKPKKENRYEVKEPVIGLFATKTFKIMDAFDCPKCGCQSILSTRLPKTKPINKPIKATDDELEQAFRQGYEKGYKDGKSE